MLAQRIIYGTLSIVIILCVFLLDVLIAQESRAFDSFVAGLLSRGSIVPVAVTVMLTAGALELDQLLRRKKLDPVRGMILLFVPLLSLSPWLSAAGWLGNGPSHVEGLANTMVVLLVAVIATGIAVVLRGNPQQSLSNLAATLLVILYVGFLGAFAVQLRCGRDMPTDQGAWLLLITLLVTKASDIGAFFTGTAIGRTKIVPSISPAKTLEGCTGGLLASVLVALGICYVGGLADAASVGMPEGDMLAAGKSAGFGFNLVSPFVTVLRDATMSFRLDDLGGWGYRTLWVVFFGLLMSAFGQLGDLLESCFKRDVDVKDSGRIMPRFGGILDLIDSPLMALPIAWFYLTILPGVD